MFKTLTDAKLYKDAGYKAFVTSQWVANNACGLIQTTATAVKDYALPVAIASANSASEFYHNMPEDTRNYVRNATLVFGGVSTVAFAASRVAKTMGTSTNGPAKKKQRMEDLGYDCYMVFVNTSLDVALARNEKRARKVAEPVVEKNWKGVQANIGKFQRLFGLSNFVVVDNNRDNDNETNAAVFKVIRRLMSRKPSTWQAKAWIRKELDKKKR